MFLSSAQLASEVSSYIWIDALWIDQSSAENRNHFVSKMLDIYAQASKIVFWLGSDDEKMTAALVALDSMTGASRFALKGTGYEPREGVDSADFLPLLKHAYWSRAWIL
ncbi:hypothetical protein LTR86_009885 [Recurvomyces mirabilis]|nr:hypothetical protein LTR86_009885 [Recurvomyces mirabilis]